MANVLDNLDFNDQWQGYVTRVESDLADLLPNDELAHGQLIDAMRYVCLNGGKRLRASLVWSCGELLGASADALTNAAVAIELIHAYSLTHDDLPAMDDDDLRRGRPSCHIAYDEATAILVGDALQTLAFELLSASTSVLTATQQLAMVNSLARASGFQGMVGGQVLDMATTASAVGLTSVIDTHHRKTAALIACAAELGGIAANVDAQRLEKLTHYGYALGLAFQVADDILDITADQATLGKPVGADLRLDKSTFVSILGLQGARDELQKYHHKAIESAKQLGDNPTFLLALADFVVQRAY